MIKIICGSKEEFEKEVNELWKEWDILADTYRVFDYGGKIIHSAVIIKIGSEDRK